MHKAKSFIPARTCSGRMSSVIGMDRDSLIRLYFRDYCKSQAGPVHFLLRGERLVCCAGSLYIHLSCAHKLIKTCKRMNQNVRMNESKHVYEGIKVCVLMNQNVCTNESKHANKWIKMCIWMNQNVQTNESKRVNEWIKTCAWRNQSVRMKESKRAY